ncbi:MAG TPA: TetR/AcrR family transcriptional regulator [Solirubrobacteraceae bacterium]|jgi:AcrR family transcriptional regulator
MSEVRERLVTAAYELFARNGVQAVGVDAIIERSGVARQTLYRHFGSKQELVLAFLERREEVWTYGWLAAEVNRRERDPRRRLLAIFDVFDEWFRTPEFEGCSFINVMLEHPSADHPLHRAAAEYLARIRAFLEDLARDAGVADPVAFAREWHILMKGSIVAAGEGDLDAALRAQHIGRVLLAQAPAARRRAQRSRTSDGANEVVHKAGGITA